MEINESEKNPISRAEDIVTEDAKVRKSQPDKPIHRYSKKDSYFRTQIVTNQLTSKSVKKA